MMGIYEIRNTINNKVYIGSSTNIPIRWKQHIEGLIYNCHENYKLQVNLYIPSRRMRELLIHWLNNENL